MLKEIVKLYKALSDETRLRILNLLSLQELCVCDIMAALKLTQSKVSRHLSYLKNVGLVQDRREGLWMHYRLCRPRTGFYRAILEDLKGYVRHSEKCRRDLERLKRLMAQGACVASLKGRYKK